MTIGTAQQEFKFRLDKFDAINYPNFEPEEIDLILNQAQQRIVKQRYTGDNYRKESFEETQKRIEDLRTLIKDSYLYPWPNLKENITKNSVFFPLPEDHWFIVQERAVIVGPKCNTLLYTEDVPEICFPDPGDESTTICTAPIQGYEVIGKYCEVRPIQHLEVDKVINDPFKGPSYDKVLRLMYQDKVEIIPSSVHTILRYKLRYIRKPTEVSFINNIDPDLPDHLLDEWLDESIKIALEGIESKRNNTYIPIVDSGKE